MVTITTGRIDFSRTGEAPRRDLKGVRTSRVDGTAERGMDGITAVPTAPAPASPLTTALAFTGLRPV